MPDVVIRAGRLLDGKGGTPRTVDVAIRDGAIAEIGRVRDRAHRIIDADGAWLIPGLTALLPPSTVAPFDRNAQRHLAPGVTTVVEVFPPAATSADDAAAFVKHLKQLPALVNRVLLASHGSIRHVVMGNKIRDGLAASNADLEAMGTLIGDAVEAGVRGIHLAQGTPHRERLGVIDSLRPRLSEHSNRQPIVLLIPCQPEDDPEEVLYTARQLLALEQADPPLNCSVVVTTHEPLDDPRVGSALSIGPANSAGDLLEAFTGGRSIPGAGLNPLAILAEHSPESALDLPKLIERFADSATMLGLEDRGQISADRSADINVIDPAHLTAELNAGVVSTLISGIEIVSFDELTGEAPGRLL